MKHKKTLITLLVVSAVFAAAWIGLWLISTSIGRNTAFDNLISGFTFSDPVASGVAYGCAGLFLVLIIVGIIVACKKKKAGLIATAIVPLIIAFAAFETANDILLGEAGTYLKYISDFEGVIKGGNVKDLVKFAGILGIFVCLAFAIILFFVWYIMGLIDLKAIKNKAADEDAANEDAANDAAAKEANKGGIEDIETKEQLEEFIRKIVKEELANKSNEPVVVQIVNGQVANNEPAPAPAEEPAPAPVVEEAPAEDPKAPIVRIPFEQRIVDADKDLKDNYNELKNEILSYGVKSRLSNSGDTFRLHRKTYIKMKVAGKGLKLYFALDPKDYADSKMPIDDASEKDLYADTPLVFKVKSDLSVRRAKSLIADCMAKDGLAQEEVGKTNWVKDIKANLKKEAEEAKAK